MDNLLKFLCMVVVVVGLGGFIGYMFYDQGVLIPPTVPENLDELATWNENDLARLRNHLDCNKMPILRSEVPVDLLEHYDRCLVISNEWAKKYREKVYDDVRKTIKTLDK